MQSSTIQIKKEIPSTHFFVHKNNQYPFNMDFFKLSSNYFTKKGNMPGESKFIELLDQEHEQKFDISHESITDFIQYLHRSPIQVNNQNVVALNYLGHKYEIEELIQNTEEYISNHHNELSLQILTIQPQQSTQDTTIHETAISDHFLEYVNDDQIFKLDISTLYRIFKRYQENQRKMQSQDFSEQIIPFLFKCLDKYGRPASVLFTGIEIDKIRPDFTKTLMEKYSNVLDFHYVNPSMMKLLYEKENQILQQMKKNEEREEMFKRFVTENEQRFVQLQKDNDERFNNMKTELVKKNKEREEMFKRFVSENEQRFNQLQKDNDERFNNMKTELVKKNEESLSLMKQKLKTAEDKNSELQTKIDEMKTEIVRLMKVENEKVKNEYKNKFDALKKEIDDLKKANSELKNIQNIPDATTIQYDPSNKFNGILTHLGNGNASKAFDDKIINLTALSVLNNASCFQPRVVLNQRDDENFHSKKEPNSWLCVDFNTHRVRPSHYSIKSNGWGGKGNRHPKSWDIDGSNDNIHWDPLDSRRNETCLDDKAVSNTFEVRNQTNNQKFYRYLRIMQKDKNTGNDDYLVIGSLEFFGQFVKI